MSLKLSPSEKEDFQHLQKTVKERWKYIRITTILMLSDGYTVKQVAQVLGIDENSVYRYQDKYENKSKEEFLARNYQVNFGKLNTVQIGKLVTHLKNCLYTTSQSICDWVKTNFQVVYTAEGMVKLLHRLGFSYKKTSQVPCEADSQAQQAFLDQLEQITQQADTAIYYTDGVHPTHNTRSLHAWIPKGESYELPTVSGRDRVNINGAVNADNTSEVIIQTSQHINAQSTMALYQDILEANRDKKQIFVICDNARYNRNKKLREWVENTKIVQLFLPPYSPNLNLIERLWKFMRKKVIDPIFYRTKEEFRAAILSFFENIAQYHKELESLLTLNFHVFKSQTHF